MNNLVLPFIPFLIYLFLDQSFPLDTEWYKNLNKPDEIFSIDNMHIIWAFTLLVFGYQLNMTNSEWLLLSTVIIFLYFQVFRVQKDLLKSYWLMIAINISLAIHLMTYQTAPDHLILVPAAIFLLYCLYNHYFIANNPQPPQ